jgi:hypothetical protein
MISKAHGCVKGECYPLDRSLPLQLQTFRLTIGEVCAYHGASFLRKCDMPHNRAFDHSGERCIQLFLPLICLLMAGCPDEPPETPPQLPQDAGSVVAMAEDAGLPDAGLELPALPEQPTTGFFSRDGQKLAVAVGRAPKSADVSLARGMAAARARHKLMNLLKENGLIPKDENRLSGSSIERYWMEGKQLFALAIMPIENSPTKLNESGQDASNSPEGAQPDPAEVTGGSKP